MEEEYIDYSCSTPIERLARDIESILRSWHVNDSDRHYSFLARSRRLPEDHKQSKDLEKSKSFSEETFNRSTGDMYSNISKLRRNSKIRSATVSFKESTLILTLWDGPQCSGGGNATNTSHIPLSLRRRCHLGAGPGGRCHDLSSLFGIGQCISLGCDDNHVMDSIVTEIQSALNIATSHCRCRIPAFSCKSLHTSPFEMLSLNSLPKIIKGYCNPGQNEGNISGTFLLRKAKKVPGYVQDGWHGLVPLLKRYASSDDITLCYVRRRYQWDKSNPKYTWVGSDGWGPSTDPLIQLICTGTFALFFIILHYSCMQHHSYLFQSHMG